MSRIPEELRHLALAPLAIFAVKDKDLIEKLNALIPYSTGIEIECDKGDEYDKARFGAIPDIIHIDVDDYEQRYRIPNGIRGLICMYNICYQLVSNSKLNMGSGIHYHVDCRDCKDEISKVLYSSKSWILVELDEWEYKGTYNRRETSWVRYNSLETLEFRIGEMTFSYGLILERVVHCNDIVRRLKNQLGIREPEYTEPDVMRLIEYYRSDIAGAHGIQSKIEALNKEIERLKNPDNPSTIDISAMFRNRTHIIKSN